MRFLVLALSACGRLGFDERTAATDAPTDAPFVESVGELDLSFGNAGTTIVSDISDGVSPHAIIDRGDGYLGLGVISSSTNHFGLIGLTGAGELDASFGGILRIGPTADDFGYGALRIDADTIIVNGDGQLNTLTDEFTIGRIDNTGAVDTSFGDNGFLRLDIAGASRQDTAFRTIRVGDDLVTCGVAGYDLLDSQLAMIRYDMAGALVASFGSGGQVTDDFGSGNFDVCHDIVARGDRLYAVAESSGTFVVAAYDAATGARATAFGTNGVFELGSSNTRGFGLALDGTSIVAVGERGNAALIVRLDEDGQPVASFGVNGEVQIDQLDVLVGVIVQPNGKLVVAGDGDGAPKVARLLADGTLDTSFGDNGIVEVAPGSLAVDVRSVMMDGEGRFVVAGIRDSAPPTGLFARIR